MSDNVFDILDDENYHYGTRPDFAVAEQNQTYFVYFDSLDDAGAEVIKQTSYFVKYIIDTKGNVVNPEPKTSGGSRDEAIGLYNLTNNFEIGKKATVKLIEPDPTIDKISTEKDILGTYTITDVGTIRNIMTTETGYYPSSYLTTMSFYNIDNPLDTMADIGYLLGTYAWDTPRPIFMDYPVTASYLTPDSYWADDFEVGFESELITPGTPNPPNPYPYRVITALTSSVDAGTRVKCSLQVRLSQDASQGDFGVGGPPGVSQNFNKIKFNVRVSSGDNTYVRLNTGFISVDNVTLSPTNQNYMPYTFFSNPFNITEGDKIYITAELSNLASGSTARHFPILVGGGMFTITPEYQGDIERAGYNAAYSPYFSRFYHYPNYSRLLFSEDLEDIYNNTLFAQSLTEDQINLGFKTPKIKFNDIQVGDNIRFEYNPDMAYKIISIGSNNPAPGVTNQLYIDVAPSLYSTPSGSLLEYTSSIATDHFTIYRVENDGRCVILDIPKTSNGTAYSGILQAEYSSQELINNFDKLLIDLSQKEIIQ
jgi:hypothetical protein